MLRKLALPLPLLCAGMLAVAPAALAADPGEDYRRGVAAYRSEDLITAMRLLRRAAEEGHAPAQARLAYILDKAEENAEAVRLYRLAVAQGNAEAHFGLGAMYAAGDGVPKDPAQARRLITRAAEAGHGAAMMFLAEAHLSGELDLAVDREAAIRWLERAAEGGYAPARAKLAEVKK